MRESLILDATLSRIDNEIDQSLNRLFDFLKSSQSRLTQNLSKIAESCRLVARRPQIFWC